MSDIRKNKGKETARTESWSVGQLERKNKKKIKDKGKKQKTEMSFINAFVFADLGRCFAI